MIVYKEITNYSELYAFHMNIKAPYIQEVEYVDYLTSLFHDTDSYGNKLFKELYLIGAYLNNELVGFVQFGKTNIGFDENGQISEKINCSVIRNLYFEDKEIGDNLLKTALILLKSDVYAFFHYFGMSCFSRHGKLYDKLNQIEELLLEYGFISNEENVYYSLNLNENKDEEITLELGEKNKYNTQVITFKNSEEFIGQCEIHFVKKELVYLRWIYVDERKLHLGFGSKCMRKLTNYLLSLGKKKLNTDTAVNNEYAQRYYEKNGFINLGKTKSYFKKN